MGIMSRHLMMSSAGLYPPMKNTTGTRTRRKKKARPAVRAKRTGIDRLGRRKAKGGRLKKGSAAAKAYMAKIRRKRRR